MTFPIQSKERSELEAEVIEMVKRLSPHALSLMKIIGGRQVAARRYKHNILGQTFNRLTVIDVAGAAKDKHAQWRCMCSCGKTKAVICRNIRKELTKSCGCFRDEQIRKAKVTHGHTMGGRNTRTYSTWRSMHSRCLNEKEWAYRHYGGRGIRICERWMSFENFLADMGEKPAGTSLDRIDVEGNYEPGNCRWATVQQQAYNKRNARLEEHEPEQIRWLLSLGYKQREIANFYGIDPGIVSKVKRKDGYL